MIWPGRVQEIGCAGNVHVAGAVDRDATADSLSRLGVATAEVGGVEHAGGARTFGVDLAGKKLIGSVRRDLERGRVGGEAKALIVCRSGVSGHEGVAL